MRTIAMRDLTFHVWPSPEGRAVRLRIGDAQFAMTVTEAPLLRPSAASASRA